MSSSNVAPSGLERGKLISLEVKNFRCIGEPGIILELDDIVVLVGPNNSGKSSLLRAYELAMSDGSNAGKVKIEDFPNSNPSSPIEIILTTEIIFGEPGKDWIGDKAGQKWINGRKFVRERWLWTQPGKGTRYGWNVATQQWSDKKPWGFAAVANTRRPAAHPVRAFDAPETQAKQIHELLRTVILSSAKELKNDDGENIYNKLLKDIEDFQKKALEGAVDGVKVVEAGLNAIVSAIFSDHCVEYNQSSAASEASLTLFHDSGKLIMGHKDGHRTELEHQGSGARRTMLWATLKYICESRTSNDKSNVLLIDEPELCLHPSAIRDACRVLYDLASKDGWQVMLTTHSPVFIDLNRDNTTVVRVDRNSSGSIQGTTLFRPERVSLGQDDKENLKLLTLYDPYVAEFFFGGRIVVVEGDTEYAAFRLVSEHYPQFSDVHIIRARGKAVIVSLAKILNQFSSRYAILHDTDTKKAIRKGKNGNPDQEITNSAWTCNQRILSTVSNNISLGKVRLLASKINFERAFFDTSLSGEKPYSAVFSMKNDKDKMEKIKQLLESLLDDAAPIPDGCIAWTSMSDLEDLN
ncbi:ATP-dependent nuclease [Acetobacter thailandicus]|uniref:ATP-dependent nuclease n=1 Tax=Acetobacter thailandicus TaxID=1502842 RepID=UPI001BAB405B|nr:AAA family ATPase [Acetobacter thailandicus]MBS0980979.1 AAA family ATPase [Acetobacter thailandicus]